MKSRLLVFTLIFLLSATSISAIRQPKNVILLIGDGMGINQMYAAMVQQGTPLAMNSMKDMGLVTTWSYNNFTTDSGAAGTALATGVKTRNGMIGMGPDSVAVPNLTQLSQQKGLAVGIVASCAVTHATPGAFVSHSVSRNNVEEIAEGFIKTKPDVFIGGGLNHFSKRADNRDLLLDLCKYEYTIAKTMQELKQVKKGKVAGLLYENHPPAYDKRGDFLPEATSVAINLLKKNKHGFFMMVEGSQIDWAGHSNDIAQIIGETLDFDKAVAVALDFARKDGNTLVIVTADHETGGLTLPQGNIHKKTVVASFSTTNHSGELVPVMACGPGSEQFRGFMDITDIPKKIMELLNLK